MATGRWCLSSVRPLPPERHIGTRIRPWLCWKPCKSFGLLRPLPHDFQCQPGKCAGIRELHFVGSNGRDDPALIRGSDEIWISIASGSAPRRQGRSPTLPNPRDTTSSDERDEKSPSSRQKRVWRISGGQGIAEILGLAAPHC